MHNVWWVWAVGSLVALVLEANLAGSFVFVFFALGAIVTSVATGTGVIHTVWQEALCFSGTSVASLLALRGPIMRLSARPETPQSQGGMVGSNATVQTTMVGFATGQVLHRGTVWMARNGSDQTLVEGSGCAITAVDNLTVVVEPLQKKALS